MNTLKAGLVVIVAMIASPSFADGFRYSGSPKFGWSYTPVVTQAAAPKSALDANASIAVAPRSSVKGGIGHREP